LISLFFVFCKLKRSLREHESFSAAGFSISKKDSYVCPLCAFNCLGEESLDTECLIKGTVNCYGGKFELGFSDFLI